ncbi:tRNA lysidine(34) synthetase TilS [Luteipulveratus sp. YIM 133132]|uniref:tRNA lysidine(34) synthetase TilS n=1 Tax=Luteipulveratus flavus TaxID=3031728 RepID=UPI0023B00DDA|nr:tRNA lysidine(34) synthetase TilS [Luteipulveratus sp. YIM 133132]MDE9364920.1 tRNA lysidine(34) synthetase TilS [Luteipulveratus sp. YIM 133132]
MPGPPPAVAVTRLAVRRALATRRTADGRRPLLLTAVSGGADSLALAAAMAFEGPRASYEVGAVVVDHGLQPESDRAARRAAQQCRELGLAPVEVVRIDVPTGTGEGPEAQARSARYEALEAARVRTGATSVVLAHTRDDQAEQVLLGLVRGSGTRSLSGMPRRTATLLRPFLDVTAAETRQACLDQGLQVWDDPHNADERYLRVRVRRVLDEVEARIGPGVRAGLARSSDLLRADGEALDDLAATAYAALAADAPATAPDPDPACQTTESLESERLARASDSSDSVVSAVSATGTDVLVDTGALDTDALADLPTGVRTRVIRLHLLAAGADPAALSSAQIGWVDDLVMRWKGQKAVDVPGGLRAERVDGRIVVRPAGPVQ